MRERCLAIWERISAAQRHGVATRVGPTCTQATEVQYPTISLMIEHFERDRRPVLTIDNKTAMLHVNLEGQYIA